MKEIISKKLNKQWLNYIIDGSKPPVNSFFRKRLNTLLKKYPNNTTATTDSNTPLVVKDISIPPAEPRKKEKDISSSFTDEFQMNLNIHDHSSPSTNVDASSINAHISPNVLSPIINYPTVMDDNLPSKNDGQSNQNPLAIDDEITDDKSTENINPEESFLDKLKQENEGLMKQFDNRIAKYRNEIRKTSQQLDRMNRSLNQVVDEKERKQVEFFDKLNDYKRSQMKTERQSPSRQKRLKRMKATATYNGKFK